MKAWLWIKNPPGQHVFRPLDNIMISMIDWLAKLFIRLKILFGVGSHISSSWAMINQEHSLKIHVTIFILVFIKMIRSPRTLSFGWIERAMKYMKCASVWNIHVIALLREFQCNGMVRYFNLIIWTFYLVQKKEPKFFSLEIFSFFSRPENQQSNHPLLNSVKTFAFRIFLGFLSQKINNKYFYEVYRL